MHSTLGYKSPMVFEEEYYRKTALAGAPGERGLK